MVSFFLPNSQLLELELTTIMALSLFTACAASARDASAQVNTVTPCACTRRRIRRCALKNPQVKEGDYSISRSLSHSPRQTCKLLGSKPRTARNAHEAGRRYMPVVSHLHRAIYSPTICTLVTSHYVPCHHVSHRSPLSPSPALSLSLFLHHPVSPHLPLALLPHHIRRLV